MTYDQYILVPDELVLADRPISFILDLHTARRALVENSRKRRAAKVRVLRSTKAPQAGRKARRPKRSIAELVRDSDMFRKLFPEEETHGDEAAEAGKSGPATS